MKDNKKFDYGDYIIEFREERNGILKFLKKTIKDLDKALNEANLLRDQGYSDVVIRKN